ncbi:aldo/keto reductase [Amycolatopsis sp. cmx-11-32]|uniref:aldo/keto reductase n=1 Tax=Amycolatopsis sp. cmx-11-32 TaxID=2785796 RepID=UPI0039E23156
MLGKALREELKRDRDNLVVATKGGIKPRSERPRDSRREWLTQGIENSLRFLDVDHIDLYQVHRPDSDAPAEETAGIPQEFVDAREDPAHRRFELRRRATGRLRQDPSGGNPPAAVSPCSVATSKPIPCRTHGRTTSLCSCTAHWAVAC